MQWKFAMKRRVGWLFALLYAGCGGEVKHRCPWSVEELLAEVNVAIDAEDCGHLSHPQPDELLPAWDCFDSARADGLPATLAIDMAFEGGHWSTFVTTGGSDLFHVEMVDEIFLEAPNSVAVERCEDIVMHSGENEYWIECVNANELFACTDAER